MDGEQYRHHMSIGMSIVMVVACGFIVYGLHHIVGYVLPIIVAFLLSFLLNPLIVWLQSYKIPRVVGIIFALALLIGFGVIAVQISIVSINSILSERVFYTERWNSFLTVLQNSSLVLFFENNLNINLNEYLFDREIFNSVMSSGFTMLSSLYSNLLSAGKALGLVLLYVLFILIEYSFLQKKLEKISRQNYNVAMQVLHNVSIQISRYLVIKMFLSLLTAIIIYIALLLLNSKFPFVWAVLVFLFNWIPSIGSLLVSVLIILFGTIQFAPDWLSVVWISFAAIIPQMVIGNFLDPRLTGDSLDLSPLIILISLVFWGALWGIPGMFLAVPLTVIIKIVCESVPILEKVVIVLGK